MADTKTSALAAKTAAGTGDLLPIVDVSDTTMAGTGTNKQITAAQFHSPARFASYSNASPSDGDIWYGSTQKALAAQTNGLKHVLVGSLFTQTADVTVANTTTETTLVGTGVGSVSLPANFLVAGKTLRVTARGTMAGGVSSSQITWKVKLGSTAVVTTASRVIGAGQTTIGWLVTADLTCRTTGASGTVQGMGALFLSTVFELETPAAATVDTTSGKTLDLTATWSVAQSGSTVTLKTLTVEVLN